MSLRRLTDSKIHIKNILPYCRPSGTFVLAAEQRYFGNQSVIIQI